MVSFEEAHKLVMSYAQDYGTELLGIRDATARVLAEEVLADRDFPPFNRATKDGIAINYEAVDQGLLKFKIAGTLPAGVPPMGLENSSNCIEIMTGAVVPDDADTVVMYEDLVIREGIASLKKVPPKGANIHYAGSDDRKGAKLLTPNTVISPASIGVMASVGKAVVNVKKLPSISVISTGKELVEIEKTPLPHQIRRSNAYSLFSSLSKEGIQPLLLHLDDDKDIIRQKLDYAIQEMDVLLLSGGVSKGKYDFLPEVLDDLGVKNVFHRVKQRPGKPFWFGFHEQARTLIFSFPGNPVSTFVSYYVYFKPWLHKSLGLKIPDKHVILAEDVDLKSDLSCFLGVKLGIDSGKLTVSLVHGNGSGDLLSLTNSDGFIRLDPKKGKYKKGTLVPFIPTMVY
ncbi:MAG: molybdopterin molybdotransferase MoeA [Flavobacteriaceae bacterium]